MNLKNISKMGLMVALVCIIIGITISRMLNAHSEPQTTQESIVKSNVDIKIKDTINVKGEFTDANVSIIVVDKVEYLVFRYGNKFEIVRHK
jgi:hypothetical protein